MLQGRPEGQVVSGRVLASEADDHVVVELAAGVRALVPTRDFGVTPRPGQEIEVYVDGHSDEAQMFVGSHDKAKRLLALERVERAYEQGADIEGEIVSAIEGGFVVDVGLRAFLPASQFGARPVKDVETVLGQRFSFRVLRFNRSRVNVVLSRRPIVDAERKEILRTIRVGAVVDAVVREVVEAGVDVDVGGADGFVHRSDLSWSRSDKPEQLAKVGQRLRLKVLKVDKKRGKVQLGLRQAQDDPWAEADTKYPPGTEVRGMVVSKTDVGCFIEFEPGLEGLVFATGPLATDAAKAKLRRTDIGDELDAVVVEVNLLAKRISLQLKE
jgi:small subunit ribosomal protein S1